MVKIDDLAQAIADGIEDQMRAPKRRSLEWTTEEMMSLARSGVAKVDLMGDRGTTLCTMDEIEAMAATLVLTGVLIPAPNSEAVTETPMFKSRRTTS